MLWLVIQMAERTFKYVDKDRFLPWVDAELSRLKQRIDDDEKVGKFIHIEERMRIKTLEDVRELVVEGIFDWQPSE